MTMGYIKDDAVYFYKASDGEFKKVCKVDDLKEIEIMEDERDVELFNKLKNYEKHWYIHIPFTKKRLIFTGYKYIGWYTYK